MTYNATVHLRIRTIEEKRWNVNYFPYLNAVLQFPVAKK